jgi:cytochrome c biogenesis protein CcmG/thiol:disulfide interchange protein DsbE
VSPKTRNFIIRGSVTAGLAVLLFLGWLHRDRFAPIETGTTAPAFTAHALDGRPVSLQDFKGKVVVLNVWATWCEPCRYEMPALDRMYQQLASNGVVVLGVSIDVTKGQTDGLGNMGGDVAEFVKEYKLTFPVAVDPEQKIKQRYGITGLPTTFIIGKDGKVVEKRLGPAKWDEPPYIDKIRALAGT